MDKAKDWCRRKTEPIMEGSKQCKSCLAEKPIIEFAVNRCSNDGRRGECKTCRVYREVNKQQFRKAEATPHNYMMCNGCDRLFHKYGRGSSIYSERKIKTSCPFCKSTDIEPY